MAFAFVRVGGTAVTFTAASGDLTVGASGMAAGDLAVVAVQTTTAASPTSITDTKGNLYRRIGAPVSVSTFRIELWFSLLGDALVSGDLITTTFSGSQLATVSATEFSGFPSLPIVDIQVVGTNASDVPPPAALTTRIASTLVLCLRAIAAASTLDTQPPTNYTASDSKTSASPSFYLAHSIVNGLVARTGGTAQWSGSGSNSTINMALCLPNPTAYNAAGGVRRRAI